MLNPHSPVIHQPKKFPKSTHQPFTSRLWGKRFLHRLDLRTVQWHVRAAWTSNYWCEDGGRKIWADLSEKIPKFQRKDCFPTKLGFFTRKHWRLDPNLDALDVIRKKVDFLPAKMRCYQKICFASRKWGPKKPPSSEKTPEITGCWQILSPNDRWRTGSPHRLTPPTGTGWSGLKNYRFMKVSLETERRS